MSGAQRAADLPDVPTLGELGYADADDNFWIGLFAPAMTSRATVKKFQREADKALRTPGVRERLSRLGAEPMTMEPEEFDLEIKSQLAAYAALIKATGISFK